MQLRFLGIIPNTPTDDSPTIWVDNDFWLFDDATVIFNHFNGRGEPVGKEITAEQSIVDLCRSAFAAVWEHATPHAEYKPE
ncbi:DUF6879 family protein [Streptomyces tsukubensis]